MLTDVKNLVTEVMQGFSGGMQTTGELIPDNAYFYAKNMSIRSGVPETRGGIRQVQETNLKFDVGFYFNEGNARYNDATHTGFWGPWDAVGLQWGEIQGVHTYDTVGATKMVLIIVGNGRVWKYRQGYVAEMSLPVNTVIGTTEEIEFVQAGSSLYMLRSGSNTSLVWTGSDLTWNTIADSAAGDNFPTARQGCFAANRLWLVVGDNSIEASDANAYTDYDIVGQKFSINDGDGDKIIRITPFKESMIIVFKKYSVYIISPINVYVPAGETLVQNISASVVSPNNGLVAKNAFVVHGEQVSYLSLQGMTSLSRTVEGTVMGLNVPISHSIQSWVDQINWDPETVAKSSAIWFDNWVLWSVPINNSSTPNAIIPFDMLANGGKGAWVGVWEGQVIEPYKFMTFSDTCYYAGHDGRIRQMFSDDPWDSEHYLDDMSLYDNDATYDINEYAKYEQDGSTVIYKSLTAGNKGNYPIGEAGADTTNWEAVPDPITVYTIKTELITRKVHLGDPTVNKIWGRSELTFGHKNPKVGVKIIAEDFNDESVVYTDQTYSQTAYDIAGTADWVDTNISLDFNNPHRGDYSLFVDDDGFYVDDDGIYLNMLEYHSLRWIPIVMNSRMIRIKVTNDQGYIKIKSIMASGRHLIISNRDR